MAGDAGAGGVADFTPDLGSLGSLEFLDSLGSLDSLDPLDSLDSLDSENADVPTGIFPSEVPEESEAPAAGVPEVSVPLEATSAGAEDRL